MQKAIPNSDRSGGAVSVKGARQVVYDSHGGHAAFYQQNHGLAVFDLELQREVRQFTNNWGYVILLGFTKDDSAVQIVSYPLFGDEEGKGPRQAELETWDIDSGKLRSKIRLEWARYTSPHRAYLTSDGRWLVGPYFGPNSNESRFKSSGLGLWDAVSGRFERRLDRPDGRGAHPSIATMAISPTEAVVAVALQSGAVILCRLDSEKVEELVPGGQELSREESCVAFTPDGRNLLVAKPTRSTSRDSESVEFERYELAGRQQPITIKLKVGRNNFAGFGERAVAFSPDGRNLAAMVGDEIRLYPAEGGDSYYSLSSDQRSSWRGVHGVGLDFAPDGRTLSAVSYDGSVTFWFATRTREH